VITVAATGHTGSRAITTHELTARPVEIAAPGGDAQLGKTILSTLNSGTTTPGADSYANYQGTSMATPARRRRRGARAGSEPSLSPAQGDVAAPVERDTVSRRGLRARGSCGAGISQRAGLSSPRVAAVARRRRARLERRRLRTSPRSRAPP
jgi:serine protease